MKGTKTMNNNYTNMLNKHNMTLVMSLPKNDPKLSQIAFDYGADVVKVHVNVNHRASKNSFATIADEAASLKQMLLEARGPMGIVLGDNPITARSELSSAIKMGFSFVSLYGHHMPVDVLKSPEVAAMFACDYTYDIDEIRQLDEIGVDVLEASIMHPDVYGEALTARDLANYRKLAKNTELPIVVPTQKAILASEVSALHETGVKAIMIGAIVTGQTEEQIKRVICDFKEAIIKL